MHSGKHQKFLRKELDSNQACRDFRHIASNGNPPFTYRRIAGPAPFITYRRIAGPAPFISPQQLDLYIFYPRYNCLRSQLLYHQHLSS